MNLASKLHYLMLLKGTSQLELANQTKIERSTLTKILNGSTTKPTVETLFTLAKYFNVEVTELFELMNTNTTDSNHSKKYLLSERLNILMKIKNIDTVQHLGKIINIPTHIITDILNGKTTNPKMKTLQNIANYFNISIPQLCGIDPLPINYETSSISLSQISVPVININQISQFLTNGKINNVSYIKVNLDKTSNKYFAIEILNNKFFPDILSGTVLIFCTNTLPKKNDLLVISMNKLPIIYKLLGIENNKYVLKQAGNTNKIIINNSDIKVYGVVVQQIINRT